MATRCGVSERGVRILCDYLTTIGIIAKEDGVYSHSPTSEVFLDPRSPASMAPIVAFLGHPTMLEPWGQLTEIVRSGRTVLPGQGTVEPDNPVWVEFAKSMVPMIAPAIAPLAERGALAPASGAIRVLDIAAGHGMFGIEIAEKEPGGTCRCARLGVRCSRLRVKTPAPPACWTAWSSGLGNAFDVDFGGPYDAVLLTNFLHHFDEATCVTLLKKIRAALKPGGITAMLEFVPNEDRVTPPDGSTLQHDDAGHDRGG